MFANRIFLSVLLLLVFNRANASDWVMDFAYAWGGQKLLSVEDRYDDGHTHYDSIRAGSGFSGSLGKMFSVEDEVGLQLNAGYKVDSLIYSEEDATFDRWTFDALAWAFVDDVRLGVGATYEVNPELDMSYWHDGIEQFDNAEGLFMQADVAMGRHLMFGVRYTAIEYVSLDYPGEVLNGDNVSMRMTFWF